MSLSRPVDKIPKGKMTDKSTPYIVPLIIYILANHFIKVISSIPTRSQSKSHNT